MSTGRHTSPKVALREASVHLIHDLLDAGVLETAVAKEMQLSASTIYAIRRGYAWGKILVQRTREREARERAAEMARHV